MNTRTLSPPQFAEMAKVQPIKVSEEIGVSWGPPASSLQKICGTPGSRIMGCGHPTTSILCIFANIQRLRCPWTSPHDLRLVCNISSIFFVPRHVLRPLFVRTLMVAAVEVGAVLQSRQDTNPPRRFDEHLIGMWILRITLEMSL